MTFRAMHIRDTLSVQWQSVRSSIDFYWQLANLILKLKTDIDNQTVLHHTDTYERIADIRELDSGVFGNLLLAIKSLSISHDLF